MTAEIGVMNRLAVALAADSAVTVGGEAGKTYASSDKLFQLSSVAPIGVMIYGNADFLGMPWETIVKVHRQKLGGARLPTVQDYAQHLLGFIAEDGPMLPATAERSHNESLLVGLFTHLRERMRRAMDEAAEKQDGLDNDGVADVCGQVIAERLKEIRKSAFLSEEPEAHRIRIILEFRDTILSLLEQLYGGLPLRPDDWETLEECGYQTLIRRYLGPGTSGIVVAGFGEDEYLPVLCHYQCEGRVLSTLRLETSRVRRISADNDASIIPFAQHETVRTFLEGIDEGLAHFIRASTMSFFQGAFETALQLVRDRNDVIASEVEVALRPQLMEMVKELLAAWAEQREAFWSPVVATVSALPKDELAAMAEALVNLTKFRRRVTPERETVGGPIDVAVITKGDGFVWVKRKHYFDPALNPRIMAKYRLPEAQ